MKLQPIPVKRALNKAYRKEKVLRAEIERFETSLHTLLERINTDESEENAKNHLRDFLNYTWYKDAHLVATKGRADLVIHTENKTASPVGVLFEVKRPRGKTDTQAVEMISQERPNAKALHELILYYFRERSEYRNTDLKYLVITDIYRWFVFDAAAFDKLFYQNRRLRRDFQDWSEGRKTQSSTDFFYQEIARPFVENLQEDLPCATFDLRDFEKLLLRNGPGDDDKLIPLFKVLSPTHLLRLPFANDSNSLNKDFYRELLHLIGLEESKEKNKKVIQRKPEGQRNHGSLLENAIAMLESEGRLHKAPRLSSYGDSREEQLFGVGLELAITWINRILFLKLLEAQLLKYHRGDAAYRFLNSRTIADFDELNELFFDVLAKQPAERPGYVQQKFAHIPYLNSSLFEISELEDATLRINSLKDRFTLPLMNGTVLRDARGKRHSGELRALDYLFSFLDAYDFSSEGSEAIQEENKTLINASVLGLIFEKINGYQDGSFFTPGFITMYMCREALRRAVVQKFRESPRFAEFDGGSFAGLANYLSRKYDPEDLQEANRLVNSIKVCDPAVGSGHFLVSSLNELIAVKSELGILLGRDGKPLNVRVEVENDELAVAWRDTDELFEYRPGVRDSQRVQEALFHEKQTLIENCLFGVDINPNSVKICRLRLWIELLKNAYYKSESGSGKSETGMDSASPVCYADAPELRDEYKAPFSDFPLPTSDFPPPTSDFPLPTSHLETLPNIDINIKQGNSLVSRFELKGTYKHFTDRERKRLKELTRTYKEKVALYKDIPGAKGVIRQEIEQLKKEFGGFSSFKDKDYRELKEKEAQLMQSVMIFDEKDMEQREKLAQEVALLEAKVAEKQKAFYEDAFEWRFEFPEVLDENGNYTGFDVVIGNPPYIRQEEISYLKPYLKQYFDTYAGTADILVFFIERGMSLLKKDGCFSYIISNKFMRANFGKPLREWLLKRRLLEVIDFGDLPVFEEATAYPCILSLQKAKPTGDFQAANVPELVQEDFAEYIHRIEFTSLQSALSAEGWTLADARTQQLLEKLKRAGVPLGEYVEGKIYYGIKTGYNEAFVIDEATKDKLIAEDPKSAEVIKPFLAGRDIKRYEVPAADKFLILFPKGWTKERFGNLPEEQAFEKMKAAYPAIARHQFPFAQKARQRYDKGEYWWELRACEYYEAFEKPKILYQVFQIAPCFIYDERGSLCNNSIWIIPEGNKTLLAILNSSLGWFFIKSFCTAIQNGYQLIFKYLSHIPVVKERSPEIEELIEKVIQAKGAFSDTTPLEAEIDLLVYKLYGLSWAEVKIVDPEFGMSEEAYNKYIL
ncbi:MAG: Eco57I restriction-modification methylase domain-containing protein [Lewinellaceae bacterium]|nr:Eco57I restriction-modification methylase domain-containing protein [Phaeodactylibacter sp.]MCB9039230.1 Eco57I restriction-modification methylase domain-containing protein [Lewinellaceae bacterium]